MSPASTPSKPKPAKAKAKALAKRTPSVLGYGDLGTSLVLIFPLFLAYEIGVMFTPTMNGVDFITGWLFRAVDYDKSKYLMVHFVLALGFVGFIIYMRQKAMFQLRTFPPMIMESAIYALTLGTFIIFVMQKLLGFDGLMATGDMEASHAFITSLGAGVHEELVFRLGMMAGGAYLLRASGLKHTWAVVLALAASSAVFSAVHHIGEYGDPWSLTVFTYRTLAGALFGLIFYFRSLSHAVYTHFLYDVYVLVLRH